jgi:hypothetical protein
METCLKADGSIGKGATPVNDKRDEYFFMIHLIACANNKIKEILAGDRNDLGKPYRMPCWKISAMSGKGKERRG